MNRLLLLTILILLPLSAQQVKYNRISKLLENLPKGCDHSIKVVDPASGKTLYSHGTEEALIPASNIKLFTTASLLNYLGEDFEINTKFLTDDFDISDSVINGNLYIKGFGDPSLNYSDVDSIVVSLKNMGIKRIEGDIIGDESAFDSNYTRDDWITDEKANVILPPVSALSMNRNTVYIRLIRDANSKNIDYEIIPNYNFIKVKINRAGTRKNRAIPKLKQTDNAINLSIELSNNVSFRKKYLSAFVENPALYFAQVVKAELEIKGISVDGKSLAGQTGNGASELTSITTTLGEILNTTNKESNNYYAECLFKLLGWVYSNDMGNSFYATQSIYSYLHEIGITTDDLEIVDGSGISRFNKLTTTAITKLLSHIYNDDSAFAVYMNSLAVGATDGTLQNRFTNPRIGKYFRGKTGTLNGVSSISGYLTTIDNKDLVVSILMSFNKNGANFYRNIQDEIIEILIGLK